MSWTLESFVAAFGRQGVQAHAGSDPRPLQMVPEAEPHEVVDALIELWADEAE